MKTIKIHGKDYVEVSERLKMFRTAEEFKGYSLETVIVSMTDGVCTMQAIIKDSTGRVIATGTAQEKEGSSNINKTSYIENCETSAWGRALGNLGINLDYGIASAEEVKSEPQQPTIQEMIRNAIIQLPKEISDKYREQLNSKKLPVNEETLQKICRENNIKC